MDGRALGVGAVVWAFVLGACGGTGGGGGGIAGGGGSDAGVGGSSSGGGGGIAMKCTPGAVQCSGDTPQSCQVNRAWANSGPPCPFVCSEGACVGSCKPGSTRCKYGKVQTCGATGEWAGLTDCEFGCTSGACKTGCTAGEFHCYGNQVLTCDPGPPSKWKFEGVTCNANSGQKCDKPSGTCVSVPVTGSSTPTGKYYQFATFQTNTTAFKGGYDVTSWGDYIYVNRMGGAGTGGATGQVLDVYKITLKDSDGDGQLEPNQHPDNPDATGPVEERTLELVQSYAKSAPDNAPLGSSSVSSLHAQSNDKIFMLGPAHNGAITEYVFATKASSVVVQPSMGASAAMSFLGWGFADSTWYAGNESGRRVYSYHAPSQAWVLEFAYPDMAGSHMDGMEVVVSPKTGEQYVYVSDMTSDFIGQYRRTDDGNGWEQVKLYQYNDATESMVEGFGFGSLSHFWATGGSYLYELGGGDIQKDLDPCPAGKQACGPNYPACPAGWNCKGGCCSQDVR